MIEDLVDELILALNSEGGERKTSDAAAVTVNLTGRGLWPNAEVVIKKLLDTN